MPTCSHSRLKLEQQDHYGREMRIFLSFFIPRERHTNQAERKAEVK